MSESTSDGDGDGVDSYDGDGDYDGDATGDDDPGENTWAIIEALGLRQGYEAKPLGLVLGCAAGDAIGAPVEGLTAAEIVERFGTVNGFLDLRQWPYYRRRPRELLRFFRLPGAHTDDTQQLMAVLECYLRHRELTPAGVARELATLRRVFRGAGRSFRALCKGMEVEGKSWLEAKLPGAAGCGSAMRAGAVALLPQQSYGELLEFAITQSIASHSDIRAHLAAALVATTAGWAIRLRREVLVENIDRLRAIHQHRRDLMGEAVPIVQAICERHGDVLEAPEARAAQFLTSLDAIGRFLREADSLADARARLSELVERIATAAMADRPYDKPATGLRSFALEAPLTAYAIFLLFGANTRETISRAVALGGDSDSIAAMAGQLSGALVGFHPEWWRFEEDEQADGGEGRLVAVDEAAEHALPVEWFLGLEANLQLLFRVNLLMGRAPMDPPDGMRFSMLNWQPLPLVDVERAIGAREREQRRGLRRWVRFFERSLPGLATAAKGALAEEPLGGESGEHAVETDRLVFFNKMRRFHQLPADEVERIGSVSWLAELLAHELGLGSPQAVTQLIEASGEYWRGCGLA